MKPINSAQIENWEDNGWYSIKQDFVGWWIYKDEKEVGFAPTRKEAAKQIREGRYKETNESDTKIL